MNTSKDIKKTETPICASWFEFLLDPTLLERHLSSKKIDPSPYELIGLFLHQADIALEAAKEHQNKGKSSEDDSEIIGLARTKALHILALKVVAFFNWDLQVLEKGLPLGTVFEILNQLIRCTLPSDMDSIPHFQLDLSLLPAEALFALQLYYRWCVRTAVVDTFPVKQKKSVSVNVPGLLDPLANFTGTKDTVIHAVNESLDDSVSMLTKLMSVGRSFSMPTLQSFKQLTETMDQVTHDWSLNISISEDETKCQIYYDLGSLMFMQEKYDKASEFFNSTRDLYKKKKGSMRFCVLDMDRLEGYCTACSHLHPLPAKQKRGSPHKDPLLINKLQHAITAENKKDILHILREDNRKLQMPFPMRIAVEEQLSMASYMSEDDMLRVYACTCVRRAQQAEPSEPNTVRKLVVADASIIDFLRELCGEGLRCGNSEQKAGVKIFIRYLCQVMNNDSGFISCFKQLLSNAEESKIAQMTDKSVPMVLNQNAMKGVGSDILLLQGELERKLLQTYDPVIIATLLSKITPQITRKSIADQMKISKRLSTMLDGIKSPHKDLTTAHIYLAKSQTALHFKNYSKSIELCEKALNLIQSKSRVGTRMLAWEKLNIQLSQFFDPVEETDTLQTQDIMNAVKANLNAIQAENDHCNFDLCYCVAFLLSIAEFDYLSQLKINNGIIGIGSLISFMCKELPNIKSAKVHAREFFEAVTLIYTTSTQPQKRSNNGTPINSAGRQTNMGLIPISTFKELICKIRNPLVVAALISCVTKLYNLLQDNLHSEIVSDFLSMWPTAIMNSDSSVDVEAISDTVECLMSSALAHYPMQLSFLHTKGDIHFANSEYNKALQYYLRLGIIATQYFQEPITKAVYDDVLYKRMIRCTSQLQCHTQSAILCQCLDKPDYGIAFKALQEQSCQDGMDSFYHYFWDVTMLEYLIYLHHEQGQVQREQLAVDCIRQFDLNSSNPVEVLQEAKKSRQSHFFCALVKQYL